MVVASSWNLPLFSYPLKIMKFCTRNVLKSILLVSVFSMPASGLLAQSADQLPVTRISGTADSSPTRLNAVLSPLAAGSGIQGSLRFSMEGDLLSVTGRIGGLDPNKRYRLNLSPSRNLAKETVGKDRVGGEMPCSNGLLSDGRVIASKPTLPEGQVETLLPDASGNVAIGTTLNGLLLASGENRVKGRTVILSEIGAENSGLKPVLIARGLVTEPESPSSSRPSRLDDIEPGEVWY